MTKPGRHRWTFAARFRARAFGWRSQPAIKRIEEAVSEIKKVARKEPVVAAEGAVRFLEKVSPALERVDSSSGAIGAAVNRAIDAVVPIIARAPVDAKTRQRWLERLWAAHEADTIPYIEALGDAWGELCGSPEVASEWADRLAPFVEMASSSDPKLGGFFHGTSACLSCLLAAGRYEELLDLIERAHLRWWPDRGYGVRALAAMGRIDEAIEYAEASCGPSDTIRVACLCEEILLAAGRIEEAYDRYAIMANQATTRLATFRTIARKYPSKDPVEILADLIRSTPGDEGKWFATARRLGLRDLAVRLADRSPCDPRTLNRAARDHVGDDPSFALEVALASLRWLAEGWGYDITDLDVHEAYDYAMKAATILGCEPQTRARVLELVATDRAQAVFVRQVLAARLGLPEAT